MKFATTIWTNIARRHSGATDAVREENGNLLADTTASVREHNRTPGLELPTDDPKPLNGLILEHMETIPVRAPPC